MFFNWLLLIYPVNITGSQNNPCVQRHPGVPDSGRGGGVYGGLDHVHKEPGTRSVLIQKLQDYFAEILILDSISETCHLG